MESLETTNGNFDFNKEVAIQRIAEELRRADNGLVEELSDEFINASLCGSDRIVLNCIIGIRIKEQSDLYSEQKEQEKLEAMAKVSVLPENKKLQYAIDGLRRIFCGNIPTWQREVIQLAIKGDRGNKHHNYYLDEIEKLFSGFDSAFRGKVFFVYLTNILPSIEAEYAKEKEIEQLMDEFVALTNGKEAEQIRAMIQTIKQSGLVKEAA